MLNRYLLIYINFIILLLSACSVYRIDIRQGNHVTQEMLEQLELNMPAKKVHFIMGTPLIKDVFHQQRWDYLYSMQTSGGDRKQRRITLFFDKQARLIKIDGDVKINYDKPQKPSKPLPYELNDEPIL
jgi:outer membrane protein assembly factor BamE